MSSIKVQFYIVAEGSDKTTITSVKRIRQFETETWYTFPEEFQKLSLHDPLTKLPSFKSAVNSLRARGNFRTVNITLPAETAALYMDEDKNFVFKDFMLPETQFMATQPVSEPGVTELVSSLKTAVGEKPESIKEILKNFLLQKFSSKDKNIEAWCDRFEKECSRFSVSGQKQIEILNSCLDVSMVDWFSVAQRKIGLAAPWETWRQEMISAFGDLSWKPVRADFYYKFLNGSYIEYSIRKEKMLMDLDRDLTETMILDLIVVGLPTHIQDSLNRKIITSIKLLQNKLKKFEGEDKTADSSCKFKRSFNFNKNKSATFINTNNKFSSSSPSGKKLINQTGKKPCSICEKNGFPERFHPESNCWFKDKGSSI